MSFCVGGKALCVLRVLRPTHIKIMLWLSRLHGHHDISACNDIYFNI